MEKTLIQIFREEAMKNTIVTITIPHRKGHDERKIGKAIAQMVEDGMTEVTDDACTTRAAELCCDDCVPMIECGKNTFEIDL
jgi:hypothetical protein